MHDTERAANVYHQLFFLFLQIPAFPAFSFPFPGSLSPHDGKLDYFATPMRDSTSMGPAANHL